MTGLQVTVEKKLNELGLTLPELESPAGQYLHCKQVGNLLYLSGKGPKGSYGKVGQDVSTMQATRDAREIALYLLAAMRQHLGSLDKVCGIVKVNGFINSIPEFTNHPQVVDGCSELFRMVFGDKGEHARTSVGVASLPGGMTVEIEAVVEVVDSE